MNLKEQLEIRVRDGLVNATTFGHLTLYNYSSRCVYDRVWDDVTMAARGLVLDDDGRVIARPWPKFFNLGERPEDLLPAETPELSKKYDGSLVIMFFDDRLGWKAVTRGCWDNDQTRYANGWLESHRELLRKEYTYLFELVAPWNRIVVHYPKDDLILLGMVEAETGKDWSCAETQREAIRCGFTPIEFETRPIHSLNLDDPAITNEEGFVARFSNGYRVKLKYKQYLYLHKIVTGLTVKGIWEILSSGSHPDFSNVPDEFMDWYARQRDTIQARFDAIKSETLAVFNSVFGRKTSRKEYALEFLKHGEMSTALFMLLDGKDPAEAIWKQCKPDRHSVFRVDEA